MELPATLVTPNQPAIAILYEEAFPYVARFVSKRGGSFEDARDVFHDALIAYEEKSRQSTFQLAVPEAHYLTGIAKHLWLQHVKRAGKSTSLDQNMTEPIDFENFYPTVNEKRILAVLELTGKKCMEILSAFYYKNTPLREITQLFKFQNTRSATVQKFRCLEKIRNTIHSKSIGYDYFLD